MLGAGSSLKMLSLALDPLDKRKCELLYQIRILTVGLLASSPPGISEEIDVGRPDGKSLIDIPVFVLCIFVIFGTGFRGNNLSDFSQKLSIKSCTEAYGLGETRSSSASCKAVKALVPPVIFRNVESRDRR